MSTIGITPENARDFDVALSAALALPVPDGLSELQRERLGFIRQTLAMMRMCAGNSPEFVYQGQGDLLLREGEIFPKIATRAQSIRAGIEPGPERFCYINAKENALANPGKFTYLEGYAMSELMPMAHAVVVDRDGVVHDPTWVWNNEEEYHLPKNGIFVAVRVQNLILRRHWSMCGAADFLGDYYHRFPSFSLPYSEWHEKMPALLDRLKREHNCAAVKRKLKLA